MKPAVVDVVLGFDPDQKPVQSVQDFVIAPRFVGRTLRGDYREGKRILGKRPALRPELGKTPVRNLAQLSVPISPFPDAMKEQDGGSTVRRRRRVRIGREPKTIDVWSEWVHVGSAS